MTDIRERLRRWLGIPDHTFSDCPDHLHDVLMAGPHTEGTTVSMRCEPHETFLSLSFKRPGEVNYPIEAYLERHYPFRVRFAP